MAFTPMTVGRHPGRWRRFSTPRTILAANGLSEVEAVIAAAEDAARNGAWVLGFLSYEAAPALDPALTTRPAGTLPLAWFAVFDHAEEVNRPPSPAPWPEIGRWSGLSEAAYAEAFVAIMAHIRAGDTYQVNHTVRMRTTYSGDPMALFAALAHGQPTPYACYLHTGRFALCSVSPELFVQRTGDRLRTEPMKGTAPRSADPDADRKRARDLRASAKEIAENVMIVDLLRNDLARVSRAGTVRVDELCTVQTLPTLHTMTSAVSSRAIDRLDLVGLWRALFPCGSVTGAPKAATMGIIAAVENTPRGAYCGALGVLAPGGDLTFSVPIRTAVVDTATGTLEYGVGSGITHASAAALEFAELITKTRVLGALAPGGQP
ncbi:MAG: aminodeoxychorismate synthase component I [Propioniciclava sp.]